MTVVCVVCGKPVEGFLYAVEGPICRTDALAATAITQTYTIRGERFHVRLLCTCYCHLTAIASPCARCRAEGCNRIPRVEEHAKECDCRSCRVGWTDEDDMENEED